MRIGLLEAGRVPAELRAGHGDLPEMFRALLAGSGPGHHFRDYAAFEGELPASTAECDAYLVTGSPDGVYDRLPWMAALQDFCRAAAGDGRKLVGVCFGHQLLADAFGGTVEKAPEGWGVGIHRYLVQRSPPWMVPARPSFATVAFHQDQITQPPPGAAVLASSEFCRFAMLQIDDNILALQGHPEMSEAFAEDLLEILRQRVGEEETDRAIASLRDGGDAALVAGWIRRFLES
jgi:GMP synthase-like glutamine amidotransferase